MASQRLRASRPPRGLMPLLAVLALFLATLAGAGTAGLSAYADQNPNQINISGSDWSRAARNSTSSHLTRTSPGAT